MQAGSTAPLNIFPRPSAILEISEELGFSSPSVFVQFFRHHTGTTPLQYRKQL